MLSFSTRTFLIWRDPTYNEPIMPPKETQLDPTKRTQPRRPLVLRLLFWVFAVWVLLGWLRFARALMDRSLILETLSAGYYYYFVLAGLISGLAALPLLWGLLRAKPWTKSLIWAIGVLYPGLYWFERLALWADPDAGGNWPFMLLFTGIWFGLLIWASCSKRSQRYFEDKKGKP